jgi:hypothetical protein
MFRKTIYKNYRRRIILETQSFFKEKVRAVAQAVSRWLPTAAARVHFRA